MNNSNSWTDWMGVTASVACAIHCAAMPLVVAFLPMLGLSFLADESFHKVMVAVCSLLAVAAFLPGLRRHRRLLPMGVAATGLAMISTAAFALEGQCCTACESKTPTAAVELADQIGTAACCEHGIDQPAVSESSIGPAKVSVLSMFGPMTAWITPLGGLLLVSAHLTNRRFSCQYGCCPGESDRGVSA